MSISKLVDIVHSSSVQNWLDRNKSAFEGLFGAPGGRYPKQAEKVLALRAPEMQTESSVRFAAYIPPNNPTSGPYSGLSFVLFPVKDAPCLIGLGVGTQGLSPDEQILGRPGHARKLQAICQWLNHEYGNGSLRAWAKNDPTRTDISVPSKVVAEWEPYKAVFDRYGPEMYALFRPSDDTAATEKAIIAFLDILFEERGFAPLAPFLEGANQLRRGWLSHILPSVDQQSVQTLLKSRRYVILQGPPGTGKTRLATQLIANHYLGHGITIQFHPNTTYENFIGGLAPDASKSDVGLRFVPQAGALALAAARALADPSVDYLLHIDEINRADLGKILGEAIFLLEPSADPPRTVTLSHDFGPPFHRTLSLPPNLHILGTMNSADRSIALVDVAVRRRFAFISLWPQMSTVQQHGSPTMQRMFAKLLSIFVEHASDDSFALVPGHSYFLEGDELQAKKSLQVNLVPLLEEYLTQGYVTGFAESIRGFLQEVSSL